MTDFDDIDPVALGAWLSTRPPTDAHLSAARAAVEVSHGRAADRRAMTRAGRDFTGGDAYAGSMWRARGREAEGLSEQARAEDNAATRAERKAAELERPLPREQRRGEDGHRTAETQAALNMAREWMADRELAERQRRMDAGMTEETEADTAHHGRAEVNRR